MCAPPGPGRNRNVRVLGVAGRRSGLRLGWKLAVAAAWSILDRVLAPRVSSGDSGSVWIGLVHSTLLVTVTSPSVGWPTRGIVGRLRRGGPSRAEGTEEPWECSSGSALIAPPNRCFDAGPRVLEPVLKSSLNPLVTPDQVR